MNEIEKRKRLFGNASMGEVMRVVKEDGVTRKIVSAGLVRVGDRKELVPVLSTRPFKLFSAHHKDGYKVQQVYDLLKRCNDDTLILVDGSSFTYAKLIGKDAEKNSQYGCFKIQKWK